MEIIGNIKTYEWGKKGSESMVSQLATLNNDTFQMEPNQSYAELWMGDHISGPSTVKATGKTLSEAIGEQEEITGGFKNLPFLFKILSIGKPLSIQVHPNKNEAKLLHAERPDVYKDPNHKPELAIALTPFLALCGFRPNDEIEKLLKSYEPLVELIGKENIKQLMPDNGDPFLQWIGLKLCYSKLMRSTDIEIKSCIERLVDMFEKESDTDLSKIFLQINKEFPNDVGSLSLFFLNVINLKPGQAIYLPAKEPHAYLSGDCIECMACSDNVIRAGLTPKYKDVDTLLDMLNYVGETADKKLFEPFDGSIRFTRIFAPPVNDFTVAEIRVPSTVRNFEILKTKHGSIMIVLAGEATNNQFGLVKRGKIIFLPANTDFPMLMEQNGEEFLAYQAMSNEYLPLDMSIII